MHPLRPRLAVRRVQQPGADQEIRTSQQGRRLVPEQHALIDHVGTVPDGLQRGLRRVGLRCLRDLDDVAPVRPEPVEHGPFVSLAPLDELLESDVELMRRVQLSPRPQQVQPRQMLTGQEVGDIAGGQPQSAAGDPHQAVVTSLRGRLAISGRRPPLIGPVGSGLMTTVRPTS